MLPLKFQNPNFRSVKLPGNDSYTINDIALLSLKTPVSLGKEIQRICLPFDNGDYAGVKLTASGWGATNEIIKDNSIKLRVVDMTGSNSADCQKRFAPHKAAINPKIHLCAGFNEGKATYFGDSGGKIKKM